MNLYRIKFTHTGQKDQEEGIKTYLLAENEEQVYEYIDEELNHGSWKDHEGYNETIEVYDKDYNVIGTETFKEKTLRIKGEMNDEDYSYDDAYYGITLYGWELLEENVTNDFTDMIDLDIIKTL